MEIFGYTIGRKTDANTLSVVNIDKKKPTSAKSGEQIKHEQVFRTKQDIQSWRRALTHAESTLSPNRIELVRIYNDITLDPHLSSLIQTRKINVLSKSYNIIDSKGEIDEDTTEIFKSAWFRKFSDLALNSLFWGTTLIEFDDIVNDAITGVHSIPYESLNPEKQIVKKSINSPDDGFNYNDDPFTDWNVEVLEQDKFGLLNKCVPLIIWKINAIGAWSIRSDIFGMPIRVAKTDTKDIEARGNMISMMQNMDKAAWAVIDEADEVQFVESASTSGHGIYDDLAGFVNSELSKLILGQTGTTDEKSYTGSAEVHERVSEDYTRADMVWFKFLVNDILIPKLVKLGLIKDGSLFGFDTKEVLTIAEQWEIDKEMIKYFNVDVEYLTEKYGTKLEEKKEPAQTEPAPVNNSVFNEIQENYKKFFDSPEDKCC